MNYLKMSQYPYHFGFKTRIYPNHQQKQIIALNSQASLKMYNLLLDIDAEVYQLNQHVIESKTMQIRQKQPHTTSIINHDPNSHYVKQTRCALTNFKPYLDRLAYLKPLHNNPSKIAKMHTFFSHPNYDAYVGAYAKKALMQAWHNHYHGFQRRPKHHEASDDKYGQRYQTYINPKTTHFVLDENHIRLPKMGRIKCDKIRDLLLHKNDWASGTICVQKDATNHYYIAVQLGSETPFVKTIDNHNRCLGIDLNLDNFATDSNGNVIENPHYFVKQEQRLSRLNQLLSHKRKLATIYNRDLTHNKDYQQLRQKRARLSRKIYNQREVFLQKLTTRIIKNHDIIVAEDLQSHHMLKNHHLAKAISDVGWRKFLTMMTYKANLYNKTFITVNPKYTTQTCSSCGYLLKKDQRLTLADRQWDCPNCHVHHIRDINAAKNILQKGLDTLS